MKLVFHEMGSGHPLIILHGLYGSGENWLTIGKALAGISSVILVDQRNHGSSPHSDVMNYAVLASDIKELMDTCGIRQAAILGHSMGGKAAMWFATQNPGRVSRLIIADISPRSYLHDSGPSAHLEQHGEILNALESVELDRCSTIGEVDRNLEIQLPDKRLRQFMLKNLRKNGNGNFEWKLNIGAISRNLDQLAGGLDLEALEGQIFRQFPVLFIRGEKSPYILEPDLELIRRLFPLAQVATIKNAGHWLHAEDPETFIGLVRKFLIQ
jgi:pimeloyl-ACP methyl ester carboxylesterase